MVAAHVVTDDSLKIKSFAEWLLMGKMVIPYCLVCDAQQFCNIVIVDFLAYIVDQVVGYFAQGIRMSYVETLLDVFLRSSFSHT